MFQTCPLCQGSGYYLPLGYSGGHQQCPTCNGRRIISSLTGLPPGSSTSQESIQTSHDECLRATRQQRIERQMEKKGKIKK